MSVKSTSQTKRIELTADRYRVAWRTRSTGGEVRGSTFGGNFYGLYTFEAESMRIRDSVIEHSYVHGLDPTRQAAAS